MFSTFADVFGSDDNDSKKFNGSNNPFNSSATTSTMIDPFGISSDMKLSASSQRFDDSPFTIETTNEEPNRTRTEKETSTTNSSIYPKLTDEPILDPLEDIQKKSTSLGINNTITHSKSINLINPFSVQTMSNESSSMTPIQPSAIDLLFDQDVDPGTLFADNSLAHTDQVQSSYDLLGLNKPNNPSSSVKILKCDSLTDISKSNQSKKSSQPSLMPKSNLSSAASYHTLPTNVLPTSPSALRVQATALSIMSGGPTSSAPFDDQFLDWLTQSDDLMCGVDPKLNGLSKKVDINMVKSTEDLLGSIYKQQPIPTATLSTVQEIVHESAVSSPIVPARTPIRRPSNEDIPAICIHEPTSEHDDSNIVPHGYFEPPKTKHKAKETGNDSDDSDDSKMVFKIQEKRELSNAPVPLLPPPPSPSASKKYKEASDDASSSSSETENEDDDPLAMFRSKSLKTKSVQKQGNNLITDWDEAEDDQTKQIIKKNKQGYA